MSEHIISAATALAKEGSTFAVVVTFEDEDGNAVTPKTLYWNLVDEDDNIINDRENVSVIPGESVTIVLQGDDLVAVENDEGTYTHQYLVIHGTYDSDLGTDLPLKDQVRFSVEPIKGDV